MMHHIASTTLRDKLPVAVNFFLPSRRRHTRLVSDWSSDVCSSDLSQKPAYALPGHGDVLNHRDRHDRDSKAQRIDALRDILLFLSPQKRVEGAGSFEGGASIERAPSMTGLRRGNIALAIVILPLRGHDSRAGPVEILAMSGDDTAVHLGLHGPDGRGES